MAYTMFGLSLASFAFAIVVRVMDGRGAEVYHGGRGLPIANIAALVTIVVIAMILVVWLLQRAWRRWRRLLIRNREN